VLKPKNDYKEEDKTKNLNNTNDQNKKPKDFLTQSIPCDNMDKGGGLVL
jgi:hypothetical protein